MPSGSSSPESLRPSEWSPRARRPSGTRAWTLLALSLVLDLVYLALLPIIAVVWIVLSRGFTRRKYVAGWREKWGGVAERESGRPGLWVHAVSVGEAQTAVPLVAALRDRFPECDVDVSVSTPTGHAVAVRNFGKDNVHYAPVDVGLVAGRVLARRRPSAILLVELELWPGFLLSAVRRGIPVFVVNGRLTERSLRGYLRFGYLSRRLVSLVTGFGVQTAEYAERFVRLGVDSRRVEVLGNLKHDRPPAPAAERGDAYRRALGWTADSVRVVVGGSTHPGEEALLARLAGEWRETAPDLRLVVVPRHVDRIDSAELESWEASRPVVRWSELRDPESGAPGRALGDEILVVDTVGELEAFYRLADIVFVGGTMIEHGGHNLFEAAQLGKPVVFGPHIWNFRFEADRLLGENAAVAVGSPDELGTRIRDLLSDPEERARLAASASSVTAQLRGATRRHIEWLARELQLFFGSGS